MMGLIEDSLRDTFASRVAAPPAIEDAAGAAIRRASGIRQRRITVATAAGVVSVVLVAAGVLTYQGGGRSPDRVAAPATTSPTAGQSASAPPLVGVPLPMDVLNRDRIQVANGQVLPLSDVGTPIQAWRVTGGWLVQTYEPAAKLSGVWLINETGARSLIASGERTMVSRGSGSRPGVQVAWKTAGRLSLATFSGGGLINRVETDGIGVLSPQSFVGGGVLLAGTTTGGGTDIWDMWFPDRGAYKATNETYAPLSQVVGATADNTEIIGLYGKPPCLGTQDPREATPSHVTCDLSLGLDERVHASPNGGWWAVTSMVGILLYAAPSIWTEQQHTGELTRYASSVAWLETTLVVIAGSEVLELSVPNLTVERSATLPGAGADGDVALVEDLRDIEGRA
jgi:hypothetical protein